MDRRSLRERKVSERFAVLDKADQRQVKLYDNHRAH